VKAEGKVISPVIGIMYYVIINYIFFKDIRWNHALVDALRTKCVQNGYSYGKDRFCTHFVRSAPTRVIYRNSTGAITGYGGYHYEELSWIALSLNFRSVYISFIFF